MIIRLCFVTLSVFKILFIMDNQNHFNSELKTEYMEKKQNVRQSCFRKKLRYISGKNVKYCYREKYWTYLELSLSKQNEQK